MFMDGAELDALLSYVGAYVGAGVGLALAFYMLGYAVYAVIDWMRGGIV